MDHTPNQSALYTPDYPGHYGNNVYQFLGPAQEAPPHAPRHFDRRTPWPGGWQQGPWGAYGPWMAPGPPMNPPRMSAHDRSGPIGRNGLGVIGEETAANARENDSLDLIMGDFSKQMVDATQKVRKLERDNAKRRQVSVFPLRKMGDSALVSGGKILVATPKNAVEALTLVERMLQILSSRLVPAMSYARQKPVSYVLAIVSSYVSRVASLVSTRSDDEHDPDAAATGEEDMQTVMITRALHKVEDALSDIPADIRVESAELAKRITERCTEITNRINSAMRTTTTA